MATDDAIVVASPFMPMFEVFKSELDQHHDRRERVIKASRDVTATSKKIIFSLQRVRTLQEEIPPKIASDAAEKSAAIKKFCDPIVPDLKGLNAWRYQRQISGGVQELMEAISFQHYLRHQSLITFEEASNSVPAGVELTVDDYVLGIFDLVGELMRYAITTIATTGALPTAKSSGADQQDTVLTDLRLLRTQFEILSTSSCAGGVLDRDYNKKMEVMKTCCEKVERAVYEMVVRGKERPKGWVPDAPEERAPVESY